MKVYLTNPHSPHGSSGQKKRQRDKVVSATLGCTSNRNNLKLTNTLGLGNVMSRDDLQRQFKGNNVVTVLQQWC